jgi:hypothetical protein
MGQKFLEDLQDQHCDYTRTTGKRFRVMRNVGEVAPYYPINEPVLCFGSGDGFEVQAWDLLGFDAVGCEISERKRRISSGYRVYTYETLSQAQGQYNIYCAHTLEHVVDKRALISQLWEKCCSVMCLIFPIEPNGTKNPSHLSPIKNIDDVVVPGSIIKKTVRWNDELEGLILCRKM